MFGSRDPSEYLGMTITVVSEDLDGTASGPCHMKAQKKEPLDLSSGSLFWVRNRKPQFAFFSFGGVIVSVTAVLRPSFTVTDALP